MEENKKKEIPLEVLGVKLDENALTALREGKETELIKGFISQKSGKSFDAFLKMGFNNQLKFRFPQRENKTPSGPKPPFENKIPSRVGGVELDQEDIEDLQAGRETKLIVGIESKK